MENNSLEATQVTSTKNKKAPTSLSGLFLKILIVYSETTFTLICAVTPCLSFSVTS